MAGIGGYLTVGVLMLAGWTFLNPTDINDRGWITGYGSRGTGLAGFVLIPK